MRNYVYILFFVLALSCSTSKKEVEKPVIDETTMVAILKDMALSDSMVEGEQLPNNKEIYQKKLSFYKSIFEKYKVSEEDFKQSYNIYVMDYDNIIAMYDSLIIELDSLQPKKN